MHWIENQCIGYQISRIECKIVDKHISSQTVYVNKSGACLIDHFSESDLGLGLAFLHWL